MSNDANQARLGARALHELTNSTLLHRVDRTMLAGILEAVVEPSLPPYPAGCPAHVAFNDQRELAKLRSGSDHAY